MASKYYTTHPGEGQVKRVIPTPAPGTETSQQRERRLYQQGTANGCRVKNNGDGTFTCPSQRRRPDGTPVAVYHIEAVEGIGWVCDCEHSVYHPGAVCTHIARVNAYLKRQAASERRAAGAYERFAAGEDSPAPTTMQDRRMLAEQALADLFGAGAIGWASEKGAAA